MALIRFNSQLIRSNALILAAVSAAALAASASAAPVLIDFETEDDFVTPLINGQLIDGGEFGNLLTISSTVTGPGSGHLGSTIFDSTSAGPNSGGGDPDLLVNKGNILMLQNNAFPAFTNHVTNGKVYNTPDDEADHNDRGSIFFDFLFPVELFSLDLIDVNGQAHQILTLTDTLGRERIYDVPMQWTTDSTVNPAGWQTLDLTTLANQPSEPLAAGGDATATEDPGFDPTNVVSLEVNIRGSGAIDNLHFVPEPTTALFLGAGLLGVMARRRDR